MILSEDCCEKCFKNVHIRNWIISKGHIQSKECDYCGNVAGSFIDLDQIGEYLRDKINSVYWTQTEVYNSRGRYWGEAYRYSTLGEELFASDNIFSDMISNSNNAEKLLENLLKMSAPSLNEIINGDEDNFIDGMHTEIVMAESDTKGEYFSNWLKFKYISKHVNRYFDMSSNYDSNWISPLDGLAPDGKRESMLYVYQSYFKTMESLLPLETTMIRARKFNVSETIPIIINEGVCGPPPSNKAKSMRMNPDGISYFYASADEDTCLREVRAALGDKIVVGEFTTIKELKVVDFTRFPDYLTDIFHPKYNHGERLELGFLQDFQQEISIPYDQKVSHLEYIPTQILTEYIRYLGYDGVVFNSSLVSNSSNYLLFCGSEHEELGDAYKDLLPPKVTEWLKLNDFKLIQQ